LPFNRKSEHTMASVLTALIAISIAGLWN
jgi:hypothetical protein